MAAVRLRLPNFRCYIQCTACFSASFILFTLMVFLGLLDSCHPAGSALFWLEDVIKYDTISMLKDLMESMLGGFGPPHSNIGLLLGGDQCSRERLLDCRAILSPKFPTILSLVAEDSSVVSSHVYRKCFGTLNLMMPASSAILCVR